MTKDGTTEYEVSVKGGKGKSKLVMSARERSGRSDPSSCEDVAAKRKEEVGSARAIEVVT